MLQGEIQMGEVSAGQHWQEHVHLCSEMESNVLRERTLAHFSASSLLLESLPLSWPPKAVTTN